MATTAPPPAILIAATGEDDTARLREWLAGDPAQAYAIDIVRTGAETLERCRREPPACLLLTEGLPDMTTEELLAALLRVQGLTVCPIVLVSDGRRPAAPAAPGASGDSAARLGPGVDECIDRADLGPAVLRIAVRGAIERHRLRHQLAEAQARPGAQLLAEAGRRLAESLEPSATLAAVTGLLVPALADVCIVDLLRPDGATATIERAAVIHADPDKAAMAAGLQRYPPDLNRPGVADALRTGRSECEPIVTDAMLVQIARDDEHLALMRALGVVSHMRVPLLARGRVLGSLLLISTRPGRRYGPDDQAMAEELAARSALALDNARLHAAEEWAHRRETTLATATRALTEAGATPAAVLPLVAHQAATLVGELAVVRLLSSDGRWLDPVAVDHPNPAIRDEVSALLAVERHPVTQGATGTALQTGRPVRVAGTTLASLRRATDPRLWPPLPSTPTDALLAVPLLVEGRALGTLSVSRAARFEQEARPYVEDDERFLQELADRAALAIERARLFADVQASLAQEQAARADAEAAVRARDQFLSIAAHELRTPTAGIKGHAQLALRALRRGTSEPERLERSLRGIAASTDRLTGLIDDLLDVARLQSGQLRLRPAPLDLAELVETAVRRHQEYAAAGLTIVLDSLAHPVTVIGDAGRLDQVVDNLLSNAVKYSPGGGEVRVSLEADSLEIDSGEVILTVRDDGIGLPAGAAEQIFRPFGRAANATLQNLPGMGLGLYISRQIVEAHGGRIAARSPGEGQGTTFTVWLPSRLGVASDAADAPADATGAEQTRVEQAPA